MSAQGYEIVDHEKLQRMLDASPPANDARQEGYALVNVLDRDQFEQEHIPGSIHIPEDEVEGDAH